MSDLGCWKFPSTFQPQIGYTSQNESISKNKCLTECNKNENSTSIGLIGVNSDTLQLLCACILVPNTVGEITKTWSSVQCSSCLKGLDQSGSLTIGIGSCANASNPKSLSENLKQLPEYTFQAFTVTPSTAPTTANNAYDPIFILTRILLPNLGGFILLLSIGILAYRCIKKRRSRDRFSECFDGKPVGIVDDVTVRQTCEDASCLSIDVTQLKKPVQELKLPEVASKPLSGIQLWLSMISPKQSPSLLNTPLQGSSDENVNLEEGTFDDYISGYLNNNNSLITYTNEYLEKEQQELLNQQEVEFSNSGISGSFDIEKLYRLRSCGSSQPDLHDNIMVVENPFELEKLQTDYQYMYDNSDPLDQFQDQNHDKFNSTIPLQAPNAIFVQEEIKRISIHQQDQTFNNRAMDKKPYGLTIDTSSPEKQWIKNPLLQSPRNRYSSNNINKFQIKLVAPPRSSSKSNTPPDLTSASPFSAKQDVIIK